MKKIILTLASVIFSILIFAQSPQSFKYQAVYRDNTGDIITDQSIAVQIRILQGSATGTEVFTETHNTSTNAFGLFNIEIGSVNPTDFASIDWASGPYYVNTIINGTDFGTSQLLSVPYALHAKTAETVTGGSAGGHYLGELYGGGIVYYVYDNGQHGLIASLDDLDGGSGVAWSATNNVEIGATAQSFYDGASNTAAIVAQDATSGYAATLCNSYSGGGQTDWYLPASWELNLLYNSAFLINKILENDGNTSTNGLGHLIYWSSTETANTTVWLYNFFYGNASNLNKINTYRVRAVRVF